MIARAATPSERDELAEAVGCVLSPAARGIVAVDASGAVRGGVLYDFWCENSVQVHMATETPMAWRCLLPGVFEYPFQEAGRNVLIGSVRGGNAKSLAMAASLGFEVEARIWDGYAVGEDLVIITMRRESCRWLREVH